MLIFKKEIFLHVHIVFQVYHWHAVDDKTIMMLKILSRFLFKVFISFSKVLMQKMFMCPKALSCSAPRTAARARAHKHEHGFSPVNDATEVYRRFCTVINTFPINFKIHIFKHTDLLSYRSILRSLLYTIDYYKNNSYY